MTNNKAIKEKETETVQIRPNGDFGFLVELVSAPERNGMCSVAPKGMYKTYRAAVKEAKRIANIYRTPICDKSK